MSISFIYSPPIITVPSRITIAHSGRDAAHQHIPYDANANDRPGVQICVIVTLRDRQIVDAICRPVFPSVLAGRLEL